jgi:hypothetical protein
VPVLTRAYSYITRLGDCGSRWVYRIFLTSVTAMVLVLV